MKEKYKVVKRKIRFDGRKPNSSYKCEYKDKNTFEILRIECAFGLEMRIYEVESKYLKATSKSIHFKAEKDGNSFAIEWVPKDIAPHVKLNNLSSEIRKTGEIRM